MLFSYLSLVNIWLVSSKRTPWGTFSCRSFCLRAMRLHRNEVNILLTKSKMTSPFLIQEECFRSKKFWSDKHTREERERNAEKLKIINICSKKNAVFYIVLCHNILISYIWSHASGPSVAEMAYAKTQASHEAPCEPPMRQTLVITFPRRVSQRQLCKPLVITAVGQWWLCRNPALITQSAEQLVNTGKKGKKKHVTKHCRVFSSFCLFWKSISNSGNE